MLCPIMPQAIPGSLARRLALRRFNLTEEDDEVGRHIKGRGRVILN
jgi:hypothetical protein